jgi:hypothetical protein
MIDFELGESLTALRDRVGAFVESEVIPRVATVTLRSPNARWQTTTSSASRAKDFTTRSFGSFRRG